MRTAMAMPDVLSDFIAQGATVVTGTPQELATLSEMSSLLGIDRQVRRRPDGMTSPPERAGEEVKGSLCRHGGALHATVAWPRRHDDPVPRRS